MNALIFAAGLGTRLKPFTDNHPKALFPVCGKPLLYHTIAKLKNAGFDNIVINVHHFSRQIIDYLESENNFCINIQISDEQDLLLDTGGAIKKALPLFRENAPILIHNVDIISDANINELYKQHTDNKNALATLLISDRNSSRYLLWNKLDELVGWKNTVTNEVKSPYKELDLAYTKKLAFSGIHVISPNIGEYMKDWPQQFSIIDFYLSIADKTKICGCLQNNLNLVDVGKPENKQKAEEMINHLNK